MAYAAFLISSFILKAVSLAISGVVLYCYRALQILKKPPGQLIFMQQIFLVIMEFTELINLILIQTSITLPCMFLHYILFSAYSFCSLYEVCIALEILIRLKYSPMGLNYYRRRTLYHILCFAGTLWLILSVLIGSFGTFSSSICTFCINLKDYEENIPFYASYFIVNLIAIVLISICICLCKKIKNEVKAKYLRFNIIYLINFLVVMNLIVFKWMILGYDDMSTASWILRLIRYCFEIVLSFMRINEPGVRQFLRDRVRKMKEKIRAFKCRLPRRSSDKGHELIEEVRNSSLNCSILIDELKLESIEYQLIAISIIIHKNFSKSLSIRGSNE